MFKFFKKEAPQTADTALEQNIFDNETFFEGYKKLRDSDTNSNDLLEQPAMRKLLPDLTNKTVIAEVVCENDPSKKLIEKLGFTKTAVGCRRRGTDGIWFVRYELHAPENEQEGQII